MIIPPIFELGNVNVVESGVKNMERIVFRPTESLNLAQFGVMIAWHNESETIPLNDQLFWFGEIIIRPPCWIVLYTGKGKNTVFTNPETREPTYIFYWGRDVTIFNLREVVPVVFKMGGILIGGHIQPPETWKQFQLRQSAAGLRQASRGQSES